MSRPLDPPSAHIRAAITLLGGVPRIIARLDPEQFDKADALLQGATKRLMRALMQLEPRRAKLVK